MNNDNKYINWKSWDSTLFGKTSQLEKAYFENAIKLLRLKKSHNVLEVGFGNGSFLNFLKKNNFSCEGVELNKYLLDQARKNKFVVYQSLGDINPTKKFDLIVLFDVIEHIPENDMEIFITKLSLLLKPDGSVFLRFPNGSSPLGLANQHGDVTHCNIITLPKLSYWCSNSDLKVVFFRGDVLPFIFRHNFLKMPSRVLRIFLYAIIERIVRIISIQSKGVLSSNLQVILKKN
jgi:2-polyprenyl-3-methyl-5-hydroxy-6-metoxy-1,4-benzoquinol methylase